MRIVSLLPGATEIVCELGLRDQLVGVSHECDYPLSVRQLPSVTQSRIPCDAPSNEIDSLVREQSQAGASPYSLREDVLRRLDPDLIVTQALCNVCAVSEADVQRVVDRLPSKSRVINLQPMHLEDVFNSVELVGRAAEVESHAVEVAERLRKRVERIRLRSENLTQRKSVVFLEWIDPPFCAGHWTPELIRIAGGTERLGREGSKSRTTAWQHVLDANPDVMIIACCGFDVPRTLRELPSLRKQPGFESLRCVVEGEVYVIDGNAYFNRPGPRIVDGLEILANVFHPTIHSLPPHLEPALQLDHMRVKLM